MRQLSRPKILSLLLRLAICQIAAFGILGAGARVGWSQQAGGPLQGAIAAAQNPTQNGAQEANQNSAKDANQNAPAQSEEVAPLLTMFPHSATAPWWISGQFNTIFQGHPGFHSTYEDHNSFRNASEYKDSLLETLYLGTRLHPGQKYNTEFLFHLEGAGGRGLSEAFGLGGFTDLDVVRNPSLGSTPYVARAEIHQTIGLSDEETDNSDNRGPFSIATKVPVRRLELRAGKMSTVDVFDLNAVGTDSHLQFTNWTVDNNGAYDYAADTRGYSYGASIEYQDRNWALRYGLFLMPTVANGINLDWAVNRARGEQVEYELRRSLIAKRTGVVRVLSYWNHAHMGTYREAVNAYLNGTDPTPTITLHEHFGALKYGIGLNAEQQLSENWRVFGRFGWNEGQHESFAYTEVDQTFLLGGDYKGTRWGRPLDKIGVAFVSNAIKKDHQNYLRYGGLGFLLGDGNLTYGREDILESYYNAHVWRGLYFALGQNFINNPGYNKARGPVYVGSVRAHVDF